MESRAASFFKLARAIIVYVHDCGHKGAGLPVASVLRRGYETALPVEPCFEWLLGEAFLFFTIDDHVAALDRDEVLSDLAATEAAFLAEDAQRLGQLAQLQSRSFNDNQATMLPDSIGQLTQLRGTEYFHIGDGQQDTGSDAGDDDYCPTFAVAQNIHARMCLEMLAAITEKEDDYKLYEQSGKCLTLAVHLEMGAEIAEKKDEDSNFHEQLGKCLDLGVYEDYTNRPEIAEPMHHHTSKFGDEQVSRKEYGDRTVYKSSSNDWEDHFAAKRLSAGDVSEPGDEQISRKEDVDRTKDDQNVIQNITGDSVSAAPFSPVRENPQKWP